MIAVASGAHEAFLRDLGADEVIDYTRERPEEVAHDVDLVLDCVGGPESKRFLKTIKRGGSLYPVYFGEFDDEENARLGITVTSTQVRSSGAQLTEIGRLLDDGTLRVAIDSAFPLKDAQAAHERAARGHLQGKICSPSDEPGGAARRSRNPVLGPIAGREAILEFTRTAWAAETGQRRHNLTNVVVRGADTTTAYPHADRRRRRTRDRCLHLPARPHRRRLADRGAAFAAGNTWSRVAGFSNRGTWGMA
ncbi:zinc-binding dehydrogenase [Lentzea sp. E54]|uniref:zinc-binding dehydrogenase n=1 Tax=Lentzea xerophila TaxID=3435883 RepID=UPI003DA66290